MGKRSGQEIGSLLQASRQLETSYYAYGIDMKRGLDGKRCGFCLIPSVSSLHVFAVLFALICAAWSRHRRRKISRPYSYGRDSREDWSKSDRVKSLLWQVYPLATVLVSSDLPFGALLPDRSHGKASLVLGSGSGDELSVATSAGAQLKKRY